jgi:hypothetical protein
MIVVWLLMLNHMDFSARSSQPQLHQMVGTSNILETVKVLFRTSPSPFLHSMGHPEIPSLYRHKAHKIDRKYCGTDPDHVGPLQQRLESFGPITSLVAGQFGDVSDDFHDLLNKLVTTKSAHMAQLEGRSVSESERGLLFPLLRHISCKHPATCCKHLATCRKHPVTGSKHVKNIPRHVTNTPQLVANTPRNVAKTPQHVANTQQHVANTLGHVTNTPWHVVIILWHVAIMTCCKHPMTCNALFVTCHGMFVTCHRVFATCDKLWHVANPLCLSHVKNVPKYPKT